MFQFILILGQLIFVLMIAIFYRSGNFNSSGYNYITYGLTLLLGFSFMYNPYRKLSLFTMILLVLVTFVSIETNMLFGMFWDSCFTQFNTQVQITGTMLIKSIYGALATLLTCLDFLGLFEYWQIYIIISFIMTIGYGLSSSIIVYGLDVYDGGGGMTVFLYSGICSLIIWFMSVRGKISILEHKKSQAYINYTISFIGLMIAFISWPIFNMGGSLITFINTGVNSSSIGLADSAYINTICALGTAILSSTLLSSSHSQSQKMKPKTYIQCFVNSGIVIATFNDLSLDPVCGMTLSLFSTIFTLLIQKHIFQKTNIKNQSDAKIIMFKYSKILFRTLFSLLGVLIAAIVIATRQNKSGFKITDGSYSKQAGLTIVGWIIIAVIAGIFGAISSSVINIYHKHRQIQEKSQKVIKINDQTFFDNLHEETFPIYKDILDIENQKIYEQDLTRRILNESLLNQSKIPVNIYQTLKKPSNHDTNQSRFQKQTLIIRNDFSKSNLHSAAKQINLSAMKVSQQKDQIALENYHIQDYSPIKRINLKQQNFESQKPIQNKASKPAQLKTSQLISPRGQSKIIYEEQNNRNQQKQRQNFRKKLTYENQSIKSQSIEGKNYINQ